MVLQGDVGTIFDKSSLLSERIIAADRYAAAAAWLLTLLSHEWCLGLVSMQHCVELTISYQVCSTLKCGKITFHLRTW